MSKPSLISGVVLNARGRPVAGARISWLEAPVAMPEVALLSDAKGRFMLSAPVPGRYVLQCDTDKHGATRHELQAQGLDRQVTLQLPR